MPKNLEIDDELLAEAFRLSDVTTTRKLVELALKEFIAARKPKDMAELRGKIQFAEDYDQNTD